MTVLSSGAGSSKAKAKDVAADQQQDMKIVASFRVTQQVAYVYVSILSEFIVLRAWMLRSHEITQARQCQSQLA